LVVTNAGKVVCFAGIVLEVEKEIAITGVIYRELPMTTPDHAFSPDLG